MINKSLIHQKWSAWASAAEMHRARCWSRAFLSNHDDCRDLPSVSRWLLARVTLQDQDEEELPVAAGIGSADVLAGPRCWPPADLAVVGYDDIGFARSTSYPSGP